MFTLTVKQNRGLVVVDSEFDSVMERNSPFGLFLEKEKQRFEYRLKLFMEQKAVDDELADDLNSSDQNTAQQKAVMRKVMKEIEAAKSKGIPLDLARLEVLKKELDENGGVSTTPPNNQFAIGEDKTVNTPPVVPPVDPNAGTPPVPPKKVPVNAPILEPVIPPGGPYQ